MNMNAMVKLNAGLKNKAMIYTFGFNGNTKFANSQKWISPYHISGLSKIGIISVIE